SDSSARRIGRSPLAVSSPGSVMHSIVTQLVYREPRRILPPRSKSQAHRSIHQPPSPHAPRTTAATHSQYSPQPADRHNSPSPPAPRWLPPSQTRPHLPPAQSHPS